METYASQLENLSRFATADIILFGVIFVGGIILGIWLGRYRIIEIFLGLYVAFGLTLALPNMITSIDDMIPAAFFLVVVTMVAFFSRPIFGFRSEGKAYKTLELAILGVLAMAVFLSMVLSFVPVGMIIGFISESTLTYLVDDIARFSWMVAPLVVLTTIEQGR